MRNTDHLTREQLRELMNKPLSKSAEERIRKANEDDGWLLQLNMMQMQLEEFEASIDEMHDRVPPEMHERVFGKWGDSLNVSLPKAVWQQSSDPKPKLPVQFYSENDQLFLVATRNLAHARLWLNDRVLAYQNDWDSDTAMPISQIAFLFLLDNPFAKQEEWRFKDGLRWEVIPRADE